VCQLESSRHTCDNGGMNLLPCVEIETNPSVTASIIWLHGLGANGHDFEPIVPELGLPKQAGVRFVFPHAPSIPVTINGGMIMPAWYDILDTSIDRKIDHAQIIVSANRVQALVDREIERGVDSRRIVLAGFSQGGAVAYHVALTSAKPLAGLMALSTYLATHEAITAASDNLNMPVLVCHGLYDTVVPEFLGKHAITTLTGMGYAPEYRTYPMQHSVCAEEVGDISAWLHKILGL